MIEVLEAAVEGFPELVAMLLDAYAADVRGGTSFADLSPPERDAVLRAMSNEEAQDVRDVVDALLVFSFGGMYSEWSGYDRSTGTLVPPETWRRCGYPGPSLGHPRYRHLP